MTPFQVVAHSGLPGGLICNSSESDLGSLKNWALQNLDYVEELLSTHGALLIRGLDIESAHEFKTACESFYPNLKPYKGGDSPRIELAGKVFTSTEYHSQLEVLLHNELSYAGWSPDRVMFGCLHPSETGGETHLADGRSIHQNLKKNVKARFDDLGIIYWQHLRDANGKPGTGLSWQDTFETQDSASVENYLLESDMQFQWTDLGIRTSARHQASMIHPVTQEVCWHNQADQWHRDMPSVKDSVGNSSQPKDADAGIESLGNHVTFGDGSEIELEDLYHIRQVSQQCEVKFTWQKGDLLIIDNVMTMHGRKPFTGKRQIVVAMA